MIAPTTTLAIVWQPAIPPVAVAAVTLVLAALAIYAHTRAGSAPGIPGIRGIASPRRLAPLVLRLAIIAGIAVILLGPSRVAERQTSARGKLTILLDTSASMTTADCRGKSRIDEAVTRWLSPAVLADARSRFDLTIVGIDAQSRPLADADLRKSGDKLALGGESQLTNAISQTLAGGDASPENAGTNMVVIGDGNDTTNRPVSEVAPLALARGVPVSIVTLGEPAGRPMLSVTAAATPGVLLEGQEGQLAVTIKQNSLDGRRASVRVRGPGGERTADVALEPRGGVATQTFTIRHEREGSYEYRVIAEATAADGTPVSAEASAFLDVTGKPLRVLVVEGQPGWDTSFVGAALRRDERLRVTQITSLMPDQPPQTIVPGDEPPPKLDTIDDWSAFDLVVLGRDVERVLKPDQTVDLVEYVDKRGGQVILARGKPAGGAGLVTSDSVAAALAKLEPAIEFKNTATSGVLAATTDGLVNPALRSLATQASLQTLLTKLPVARASYAVDRLKPAATPLLVFGAGGPPALVTMPVGRGGVTLVAIDNTWRWSLLSPEQRKTPGLAGAYDQFWGGLARWMVMRGDFEPGKQATLQLDNTGVNVGQTVGITVACRWTPTANFQPRLTVTDGRGRSAAVALTRVTGADARWHATVTPTEPGVFKVALDASPLTPATQERRFQARGVDLERLHSASDPASMRKLAEISGGLALAGDDAATWPEKLAARYASRKAPDSIEPLWPRAWLLAALVSLMGVEWIVRRRMGWL